MKRAIIIVLDSLGIGGAEDAAKYNDQGSNTLGHIAQRFHLHIPNLTKLGLVSVLFKASGEEFGLADTPSHIGCHAIAQEISSGKDTVSGHWEMAGCPVIKDWGYFTQLQNTFPEELTKNILTKAGLTGFLGNCHASGTAILDEFGEEHIRTGFPIFYTSADSVFQIAAHEQHFGLDKLYNLCEIARKEVDAYNICRVIARPFIGEAKGTFERTHHRKDYAVPPIGPTILDVAKENNVHVVAIGKTGDIFAHRGINDYLKTPWNEGNIKDIIWSLQNYNSQDTLIFANLSDFDVLYGHRRDPIGYGKAINYFDKRLPEILDLLREDDLLIITADHGNDPTWKGTDHTRELIPILIYQKNIEPVYLGKSSSFCDIAQTVAEFLNLPTLQFGKSLYSQRKPIDKE